MDSPADIRIKIQSAAAAAANDWFNRQCADLWTPMFLYYKPGSIAFYIGAEPLSDEWVKASPTKVRIDHSAPQVQRWVVDRAQSLPILGEST